MRGLRLFVRPIEAPDHDVVNAFLEKEGSASVSPACGLLGKLLGDIVAVVTLDLTGTDLHIVEIVVAKELRRKWIGRVMMREVELLAGKMDRRRMVVEDARGAQEFFRRVGFESEGAKWVRTL